MTGIVEKYFTLSESFRREGMAIGSLPQRGKFATWNEKLEEKFVVYVEKSPVSPFDREIRAFRRVSRVECISFLSTE